jgi:carbon monoxide dehydrogenase subunit G
MELSNEFRVALPVERAWGVLTDVERIAPCLPGAQLQEVEGDEYRGVVKVKVGPITAQYKGQAKFLSLDPEARVAVLRAEGRETRGQGNANATITAVLTPDGEGTAVSITTDLTVTGRVAQFGRGVLADVSAKLLDQFVADLEKTVLVDEPVEAVEVGLEDPMGAVQPDAAEPAVPDSGDPEPVEGEVAMAVAPPEDAADKPVVRKIDSPEAKPVDLLDTAGSPVAKRVAPVLVVIALLWVVKKLLTRNKD